jgi:hypothetical protein
MRIVSISTVRNEADIVEAWVRYHEAVVDEMVIDCHRPVDNTREILEALAKEGLPLTIRERTTPAHMQGAVLTERMHEAAEAGADWILPLDADEFLVSRTGMPMRDEIAKLPPESVALLPTIPYAPTAHDPVDANVLVRITHRAVDVSSRLESPWRKVLVPGGLVRGRRVRLPHGSQALLDVSGDHVRSIRVDSLALAHFPYRSSEQVRVKVVAGWISSAANPDRGAHGSFHWESLFRRVLQTESLRVAELQGIALAGSPDVAIDPATLAADALPAQFEIRHHQTHANLSLVLADAALALANERAQMRARSPSFRVRRSLRKWGSTTAASSDRVQRRLGLRRLESDG